MLRYNLLMSSGDIGEGFKALYRYICTFQLFFTQLCCMQLWYSLFGELILSSLLLGLWCFRLELCVSFGTITFSIDVCRFYHWLYCMAFWTVYLYCVCSSVCGTMQICSKLHEQSNPKSKHLSHILSLNQCATVYIIVFSLFCPSIFYSLVNTVCIEITSWTGLLLGMESHGDFAIFRG